jgi:thiol:disulfide interchange protein DsbC
MKYVLLSMALTLLVSCAKEENTNIDISKKVSDAYPSISIDKIRKIDDKFHELIINNQVYYATNDGKYLIVGNVIDLDTKESIT